MMKSKTQLLKNLDFSKINQLELKDNRGEDHIVEQDLQETVLKLKRLKSELLRRRRFIYYKRILAEKLRMETNGLDIEIMEQIESEINEGKEELRGRKKEADAYILQLRKNIKVQTHNSTFKT